jgi:DNA polymerase
MRRTTKADGTVGHEGSSAAATTLDQLRRAARACTACDLYRGATQIVFGEGDPRADIVLVGEQPGNDEDLAGHPFVGPAGRLLDAALARAGIDRRRLYVTNVVKHFKWKREAGGKRRIHDKPRHDEVEACRPWLDRELWLIEPRVIVCLGVTAATAVLGRRVTVTGARGRAWSSRHGMTAFVTVHPSAILRIREDADREAEMQRLVDDLERAQRAAPIRLPARAGPARARTTARRARARRARPWDPTLAAGAPRLPGACLP